MSPSDKTKVTAANQLYAAMSKFVEFLEHLQIPWVTENPSNSWLWELPELAFPLACGHLYHLHACAYGGRRKKNTALLASDARFSCMERFCDGTHSHEGWGFDEEAQVFNTSKEAEYPKELCEAYTDVLVTLAQARGISIPLEASQQEAAKPQKQPRGRRLPQIVSEYGQVITRLLDRVPSLDSKQCLQTAVGDLPCGARLLRSEAKPGQKVLCVFGVYRSMESFVEVSRQLWHPYDELMNLPDDLIRCLFLNLTLGLVELTKHRIKTLDSWTQKARALQMRERDLHKKLNPKVARILKGKRLLVLEELAKDIGWPDERIHQELREGFKLTGHSPPSHIFKQEFRPASMSKEKLMQDSKFIRPLILGKLNHQVVEDEDERELYDITLREANEKGWLEGPLDPSSVSDRHQGTWLPVRRFGVRQKGKLRPIDDMKENHLNDCFSSCDKIDLHALDHILWSLCVCVRFCKHRGAIDFKLSDGSRLKGQVHESWSIAQGQFRMTSFDLASAYKQLPLHPEEYCCSIVTLKNPDTKSAVCFEMRTLPFGSVASVLHFNRISRLIWALGLRLGILWTNYFDDYPTITHEAHQLSTMTCVKGLFELLGFAFGEEKLAPFGEEAKTLGVLVNLSQASQGKIVVDNKPSRKQELLETIDKVLGDGFVIPIQLPSILGRMQFADMQLAGKMGGLAMADLRALGHDSKDKHSLSPEVIDSLVILKQRFSEGKPRTLTAGEPVKPILIYTDGAFEFDDRDEPLATIGAVMLRPNSRARVFGTKVHPALLERWLSESSHPIGLVELYGVATAFEHWSADLKRERVIFFCGNWTTIDVFVRGYSALLSWRHLLLEVEKTDARSESLTWIARVASSSNVADPPSRGSLDALSFQGELKLECPSCPVMKETLESLF